MATDPDIAKFYEFHINEEQEERYHLYDDQHLRKPGLVLESVQTNAGLKAFDQDGCTIQRGAEEPGAHEDPLRGG